jgi:CTP synthase
LELDSAGLGDLLVEALRLDQARAADLDDWRALTARIHAEKPAVRIALVGKYVELHDAYLSVAESLHHAAWAHGLDVEIEWVNSETLESRWDEVEPWLKSVDGIVVPGGFGSRGIEGKVRAAQLARETGIPYLGLCLGLQVAVIEFARHVLNLEDANSSEFEPNAHSKVIDLMPNQRNISDKGGTMRLGQWVCCLTPGTRAHTAYGEQVIFERHRHRYEVNNAFRKRMEAAGMVMSGRSADNRLVEIIELKDHPWFVATQFHPEFKSRPTHPHPLFHDFVGAAAHRAKLDAPPVVAEASEVPERAAAASSPHHSTSNGHSPSATQVLTGGRPAAAEE